MSIRRVPYWLDRMPVSRRPSYARLRGQADADVVVVGAGLTGCACAWTFAAAGVKTVVLEAATVGGGATARGHGLIREDFDVLFQATASLHGLRAARALWLSLRRAALEFPAALRRLGVRCDLAPQDLLTCAPVEATGAVRLRREYESRRAAGLDHRWLTPAAFMREAALESGGAIRTHGASIDPYRTCLGLAHATVRRGAAVHEKSPVRRVRAGRKDVEVTTDAGSVRAKAVVIATAAPLQDLRALRRHLKPRHGYSVVTQPLSSAIRRDVGRRTAAIRDASATPHLLRWLSGDRILFSGAEQAEVPPRLREKTLIQRTGQLMYELSVLYPAISGVQPDWGWDFPHYETVDGLPFVGLHRNFPRHLFALGGTGHGAAVAWLASRLLLRQYQASAVKGDELFGFARVL
jgi:gamma-glutamylputrescine oxidase